MKRIINFFNRTKEQLYKAYVALRQRYKHIEFVYHIYCGMFHGYFVVEGRTNRVIW